MTRNAYLLAGPTASGKSSIAAALAREMGAVILSADSMLVYRGMDIGTAKPPPEEIAEFRMGGVDVVTPAEEFSAGAWLRAASAWAAAIPEDTPIVIAGGTGLYFSALLRGLDRAWSKPPPCTSSQTWPHVEKRRMMCGRILSAATPAKPVAAHASAMVAKLPERRKAMTRKAVKKISAVPKSPISARQPHVAAE